MGIIETSHKNTRKPQKRSSALRDALLGIIAEYDVMTVRQLYYQAEMRGYVGKTDADYNRVQYQCLQMRRSGAIPYRKIADSSRDRWLTTQYGDMVAALGNMHRFYRRDYWQEQAEHVEIWCEKDALTGVISPVCAEFGVTYVAMRGFDSDSLAYETAEEIKARGKPAHIFLFCDHDPSGWWMGRNLEERIRQFGTDARVTHVAVHPAQIAQWHLPTRKAKHTDSRFRGFVAHFGSDACTELDAIPPNLLAELIRGCIRRKINWPEWLRMREIENAERETLESIAGMVRQLTPGATVALTN